MTMKVHEIEPGLGGLPEWLRKYKFHQLIICIPILFFTAGCQNEESEKMQAFHNYYAALTNHSDEKWDYSTDTVKLWFDNKEGSPVLQFKEKAVMGEWIEWDKAMNTRAWYDSLWFDKDANAVKGLFYEENDFYELIGKGATKTLRTYWLNDNNRIKEILIYWIPEENTTTAEHLEPIVKWAMSHDATEIQQLYPEGRLIPSKDNALRWKKLLKEYRADSAGLVEEKELNAR